MIDETAIQEAVDLLLQAARGATVVVFGSWARGEADARSDLDLLVIEPSSPDAFAEMVRLGRVLAPMGLPEASPNWQ